MIAGMGRSGGGGEVQVEEDGRWRALRSGGERAGRFGGQLDDETLEGLKAAAAAAAEAGPPTRDEPWPPGGAVDTFWAGEVVGQLTEDEEPSGPWGELAARCRSLFAGATDSPAAALELSVVGDGRLSHVGGEPAPTDGAGFSVEATLYGADSSTLGSWSTTVAAPETGEVGPGWEAPLGLAGSGLHPISGQTVSVWVTFSFLEGLPRPMTLTATT